jgi:hypothetical protein
MKKQEIIEVLSKWNFWNREIETGIPRRDYTDKLVEFLKYDKVISIIGIRRSGKSFIIRQLTKELINSGLDRQKTLIINFEEPVFEGSELKDLLKIYDSYVEIIRPDGKPFVFLDEIQNVPKWEKFVRGLNERKEASITISGSSSKLLSEELATVLAGRQIYFEIFPLSLKEFLNFKNLGIKDLKDALLNSQKIKSLMWDYLKFGGFPEVVISENEDFKLRVLRSYYDDIVTKDVARRFKIRKVEELRSLVKFYLTNIASQVTLNSISKFLKLPTETVRRFSDYIETSKAIFFVKRFSFSFKQQEKSPRKVYSTDNGLVNAVGFRFSENYGRLMENVVAIDLKRRQSENPLTEVYYWKDYAGREVDFLVKEGPNIRELIQVTFASDRNEIEERELKTLIRASKEIGCKELFIITWDYEAEEELKDRKIKFVPLWKWLLGFSI